MKIEDLYLVLMIFLTLTIFIVLDTLARRNCDIPGETYPNAWQGCGHWENGMWQRIQ